MCKLCASNECVSLMYQLMANERRTTIKMKIIVCDGNKLSCFVCVESEIGLWTLIYVQLQTADFNGMPISFRRALLDDDDDRKGTLGML